jgi:hypothetical protein
VGEQEKREESMLESLVITLLSSYLGRYLKGLEPENLKFKLGDGDLVRRLFCCVCVCVCVCTPFMTL